MSVVTIVPQFSVPVHQTQQTFRQLLKALSRPGLVVEPTLPPDPPGGLQPTVAAIALTLFDHDTPVWMDENLVDEDLIRYLHFHTGAPHASETTAAHFALLGCPEAMPPLDAFAIGDAAYPDRSTTLVLQLPSLQGGQPVILSGPGIDGSATISPRGLPSWFWRSWNENTGLYPLGVDIFLADCSSVIGLPRTTKVSF